MKRGKRRGGRLDVAMAALVAFAAGFAVIAMPATILTGLTGWTRLALLLPAGAGARPALASLAVIAVFLPVFLTLRRIGGRPHNTRRADVPPAEQPRLRRADMHPDAPSCRPIFAGADLGAPLPPVEAAIQPSEAERAEWMRPMPAFLEASEPEPEEEEEEEEEPLILTDVAPSADRPEAAEPPRIWPEIVDLAALAGMPHATPPSPSERMTDSPEPAASDDIAGPVEPVDEQADFQEDEAGASELAWIASRLPRPQARQADDTTVSGLIQRLEIGLIRREHAAAAEAAGGEPHESDDAVEARLRDAVGALRSMAGKA